MKKIQGHQPSELLSHGMVVQSKRIAISDETTDWPYQVVSVNARVLFFLCEARL